MDKCAYPFLCSYKIRKSEYTELINGDDVSRWLLVRRLWDMGGWSAVDPENLLVSLARLLHITGMRPIFRYAL